MKKILAFLMAVTTCFCVFTACGNKDGSSSEKSDKKSSSEAEEKEEKEDTDGDDSKNDDEKDSEKETEPVKETETETVAPEVIVIEDETDKPAKDESSNTGDVSDDFYIEFFKDLCQKSANNDADAIMELALPEELNEAMKKTGSSDAFVEEFDFDDFSDYSLGELAAMKVTSVTDYNAADLEKIEKCYSVLNNIFVYMAENNISYEEMDEIEDDPQMNLLVEQAGQLYYGEDVDVDVTILLEAAKSVILDIDGWDEEFFMYKPVDEGWKIDFFEFSDLLGE